MNKIITQVKNFIKETDKILLFLCIAISVFGVLLVSSATLTDTQTFSRDAKVMLIAVSAGVIISIIISAVDYNFIIKLWPVIGGVCIILMLLLFIPGVGVGPPSRPDVKTWIPLGSTGLYFQPSELFKIGFIITFSVHLDNVRDSVNNIKTLFLLCIHGAVPVVLVLISGDMGSALIFILIFVTMLYSVGLKIRYFVFAFFGILMLLPVIWQYVLSDIQKDRIYALFSPEDYPDIIYQQEQGLRAIKNGGIFGKGLYNGQFTDVVPENENDMIFSIIGEEFGLVGCLLTLLVFALIVYRIIKIGKKSSDKTVSLICSGTVGMIAGQVLVNVGMCLKLLPVIGITLPFLSAGGSSNLCIYIAIGLLLSLSRYTGEKEIVSFRLKNISTPFN